MRLKLSESPVFKAMKAAGETAKNPFIESFTYPGNWQRLFVALFGIAAGLTVIWYTAMFTRAVVPPGDDARRRHDRAADRRRRRAGAGCSGSSIFGRLSDRVGRKTPIVIGYALTLVLLFPIFWMIGSAANPELADGRATRAGGRLRAALRLQPVRRATGRRPAGGCSIISRRRASPIPRRMRRRRW